MMNWDNNFDISYHSRNLRAHADKLNVILTKNLRIVVIFFFNNKKDVKVGVLYKHVIDIQMNTDALLCRSDSESIVCRH